MATPSKIRTAIKNAAAFRTNMNPAGLAGSGLIVIYKGRAVAWRSDLFSAGDYEPGCLAVGAESEGTPVYEAVGGNAYDGAEKWERVK